MKDFFIQYEAIIRLVLFLVLALAIVGLNAAYLVWVERKGAGRFQRRPGPTEAGPAGLLQPPADGLKLMAKQFLIPPGADRVLFCAAPLMVLTPAFMTLSIIPWGAELAGRSLNYGLLLAFSFGSINVMALMLGGWASRNKYAIISAARAVSQNVAYEIPLLLVVVTMIMITGTMNLSEIVDKQAGGFWHWNIFKVWVNPMMPVTFLIFFICLLAEANRAPFDLAEAESELVAGAFTEYSSMGFGVFFVAEYANIVVSCALATILFLGGWQPPIGNLPGIWGTLVGPVFFCVKMYALIFTVVWVRWTFPRTQFYGLLNLSWKVLIPFSLFTLLLTSALIKLF
jgi:NADH-quinone oxidoreductase subunit H